MQKTMTNKEYQAYVEKKTPNSKTGRNVLRAFLIGGLICTIGQFITNVLKMMGYGQEQVSSIVSLIMIFIGALLTGLDIYDDIGRYAGAGSIVPITGFANSIVSPAIEFKSEGYVMGVGARMFVVAGPVLVYGISTSIVAGIIYFLLK
ncbi:MAG TPA: stage V sporulation protein AC [Hungateiclostridium thermocellum]|jgi:stage V sporulation protein AC|uniref:Stage V sporulation protein AC n=2 Tax=Acetivibrio thermocellus TaxID=1515 RepID=A3DBN4_ACET2|nr:stage V sporulation protein AC [Acetivibrio thermocellus]CDG34805.1 SpoVA protein [Acetivibrio thermocellus BC1]ABN51363.1 stage V sporulation protein AC [Acetivibrio thermocellus ATCC 27405]ADU75150.1 stage V sporulation protein AC [Acetivibrio thermocellus DSM 1313]ALX09125.1 stage V sporulation protein AC [Acetivibrio thermocellus AD2]ANV76877.1 stage V sporulation protein AC [Acetivibrio thermocellus DSM 2360]